MGCYGLIPDVPISERSKVPYCECTVSYLCQKKSMYTCTSTGCLRGGGPGDRSMGREGEILPFVGEPV